MIYTADYFKHKDVVFLEFGTGDITFVQARNLEEGNDTILLFFNQTPANEIGEEGTKYVGKTSDELEGVKVLMRFTKPESITALIHSLATLQKSVFKHALTTTPWLSPQVLDRVIIDGR